MIFQSSENQGGVSKQYAPVALFVYNRPWHTKETVEALLQNPEAERTPLYIFADGAKPGLKDTGVDEVRAFIRQIVGFASLTIVERDSNFGLAKSIIDGVSRICREHGCVIVMEDDLVTSSFFLRYMNEGLEKYRNNDRVISIHGYVYPVSEPLPETFFLRGADCWGWATWERGWQLFESDGHQLMDNLRNGNLVRAFDFDNSYPYFRMLKNQVVGNNNSWAVRWYASAFLADKLTLYPGRTLVTNIGVDGSGTHCAETTDFIGVMSDRCVVMDDILVEELPEIRKIFSRFYRNARRLTLKNIVVKVLKKLKFILRK